MASGAVRPLSILILLAAMVAVLPRPSHGQLRADEIAGRAEWEAFLASAEIVGRRQITGPEAVTEPWVLTLRSGPVERQALWKDVDGKPKGVLDCWRYEIAAYRLDKALGLGMVPATVERRDGGAPGLLPALRGRGGAAPGQDGAVGGDVSGGRGPLAPGRLHPTGVRQPHRQLRPQPGQHPAHTPIGAGCSSTIPGPSGPRPPTRKRCRSRRNGSRRSR